MRYFFKIAYKGTAYHGWQKQKNALSVQEVVENAFSTILQETIAVTGSGRTDAGVHCEQQFFHAELPEMIDVEKFMQRINVFLPPDISILSSQKVREDAHARFDAIQRKYAYKISRCKNPFLRDLSYHFFLPLDLDKMNEAASLLLLHKDFQSFSKVKSDVHTYICDITRAEWVRHNELLIFYVSANRFLRGMVRAITGTLLDVGSGKTSVDMFEKIIESRDRQKAGRAVPPQGLFLTQVEYPKDIFIN